MDYLEYFELRAEPFSHAPLSEFYYASHQHTAALERLTYAARAMRGLALLVGDIGRGKTTLARRMLDMLPEDEFEAALLVIVHTGVTPSWLLKRLAIQLGVEQPDEDKLSILSQLYERLVQIHESGKKAVVLIDEAQMLCTRELMEEFRGLLNLEVPGQKLISFVFFGLPEIEGNLRLDPPLAQRVAMRCHLRPLELTDTKAYIQHRLRLAGAQREVFADAALQAIHRFTGGVPRLINTLCDNVLLEMFFEEQFVAEPDLIEQVAQNLRLAASSSGMAAGLASPSQPAATAPSVVMPAVRAAGRAAREVAQRQKSTEPGDGDSMASLADDLAARVAAEPLTNDMLSQQTKSTGFPLAPAAEHAEDVVDDEAPLFQDDVPAGLGPLAAEAGAYVSGALWTGVELAGEMLADQRRAAAAAGSAAPSDEPSTAPKARAAQDQEQHINVAVARSVAERSATRAGLAESGFDIDVDGLDDASAADGVAAQTQENCLRRTAQAQGSGFDEPGSAASVQEAVLQQALDAVPAAPTVEQSGPKLPDDPYYDEYDERNSQPIPLPEYSPSTRPAAQRSSASAAPTRRPLIALRRAIYPTTPPEDPLADGPPPRVEPPAAPRAATAPEAVAAPPEPAAPAAAGGSGQGDGAAAESSSTAKRGPRKVRTSSGQTLDMGEIDDLLADVVGKR